ncbi:unnamed protein product [Lactuca saligna]|uniref:Auxin-responsive protein n=1 Tax=Lactuca saligna TaxID=75948 RepID=A0AA35Y7R9_LACSI|nr:unnamed protein product [Lactuca saligna]
MVIILSMPEENRCSSTYNQLMNQVKQERTRIPKLPQAFHRMAYVDIITNLKFKQIRGATKSARSSTSNTSCNVGCRCIPSVGSLAVYAGEEHRCFVIPTRFLNLLVFVSLLNKVEEEFGFQTTGKFVLPCDVVFFKELLNILEREKSGFGALDLDDFLEMFSDLASDSYSLCKKDTIYDAHIFTSLL